MKAFEVYGEISLKGDEKVKKGLKGTASDAEKTQSKFTSMGKSVVGAMAAYASVDTAIRFMKDAAMAASDLSESVSKSEAVFLDAAAGVQAFAKTTAVALGQSEQQALEAAGTFGNLLVAFDVGTEKAAEMSIEMVKLASDLASFNNTSVEEAILAIRSGLSGETEPLKRYGVALTDARLKATALDMGLIETASVTLPASVKALAAYELMLDDTAVAQGDFSRTADGMANSLKTNAALWEDTKASIGSVMEEPIGEFLAATNAFLAAQRDGVEETGVTWHALLGPLGAAWGQAEQLNDTIEAGTRIIDEQRTATTNMSVEQERMAMRLKDTEEQYDATREATRAFTEATIEANSAVAEAEDAELKMLNTQVRVEDRQKALTEAVKEHGEGSQEARIAQLELNKSMREAEQAAADYALEADEARVANEALQKNAETLNAIGELAAAWEAAGRKANEYRSAAQRALSMKPTSGGTTSGIQREDGGRTVGPSSGYPVTMHGIEWVIPERRDANSLALWRDVGQRIGAFEDSQRGVSTQPVAAASGGGVVIIADPRYTDMDKVRRDAHALQRGDIGVGAIMGRMGMAT